MRNSIRLLLTALVLLTTTGVARQTAAAVSGVNIDVQKFTL